MKQTDQKHRCGINDIREFIINYVMKNCRRNTARQDQQYKITTACFHAWHEMKYGTKAPQQCLRTLTLYLIAIAQEQNLQITKEGNTRPKYILTKTT